MTDFIAEMQILIRKNEKLEAENKQLKLDLDFRDMLLEQIIKVVEGAAQALKETQ